MNISENQNYMHTKINKNNTQNKTVLFCGPIENPINSGRYMIAGMKQLGYTVVEYDYRTNKNYEKDLLTLVEKNRPLYILTLKGEKLSPALIKHFKASGCITILCFTMSQIEDWMVPFAKAHDFVITNVESHLAYFSQLGVKNIKWIHQGFSPEFFGIDGTGVCNNEKHYADIAMIGSMGNPIYRKRCELLLKLRQNNFDIKWWGPHLSS